MPERAEVTGVDVGEVNGRVFVNNASIGVYPEMVNERDALRRGRGWGEFAPRRAIVRTLRGLPFTAPARFDDPPPIGRDPAAVRRQRLFDEHGEHVGQRTSLSDDRLGVYVARHLQPVAPDHECVGRRASVEFTPRPASNVSPAPS